jgi:class 3 adenylate cyclase
LQIGPCSQHQGGSEPAPDIGGAIMGAAFSLRAGFPPRGPVFRIPGDFFPVPEAVFSRTESRSSPNTGFATIQKALFRTNALDKPYRLGGSSPRPGWDATMDIGGWLRGLGLGQYEATFRESEIDAEVLLELTESDLRQLGVPLGHRKRLLKVIAALGAVEKAPTTVAGPLREDAVSHGGERRQLTVMFCDLVGSTALSEKLDPEEPRSLLHAYRNHCGDVISRYDGFVARYVGDGILTYFGWPTAHEEDAERAVRTALDIVHTVKRASSTEDLSVRVGIATGPVVVGETAGTGDQSKLAVGSTPNLAARLQGLAVAD